MTSDLLPYSVRAITPPLRPRERSGIALRAMSCFSKSWGRCPQRRVKGWVLAMLAMLGAKTRLCVAARGSGPRFAALDALPPAFATWQGCRTSPAPRHQLRELTRRDSDREEEKIIAHGVYLSLTFLSNLTIILNGSDDTTDFMDQGSTERLRRFSARCATRNEGGPHHRSQGREV